MRVIPALLIWALFQCYQLGNGGIVPCPGPNFLFLGSCYRFVDQRTDFWRARKSCLDCGGQLASLSENSVLTFLRNHLNGTSWWVGQDIEAHALLQRGAHVCLALTHSGVLQEAHCLQQNGFICQTDGHGCSSQSSYRSAPPVENHVQVQHSAERTKRFVINQTDIPDISQILSQQLSQIASDLRNLLTNVNSMMDDGEVTNTTQLNATLTLLNQLSNMLPNMGSSPLFNNLSSVVYFGVNGVIRTVLSSCSEITGTAKEKQSITDSALKILVALQLATLTNLTGEYFLQTPLFSMLLKSMNISDIGGASLSFPGQSGRVVFPTLASLNALLSQLSSVQVQLMSFAVNPFVVDTSTNITSTVVSLSLNAKSAEIGVHNLSDYFQIFLPQNSSYSMKNFQTSKDYGLQLSLTAPTSGSTLAIIASGNHGVNLNLYHGQNIVTTVQVTKNNDTDSHTWLLTPDMFSNLTTHQTFFVAPANDTTINNIKLSVSTFSADCKYWDSNLQKWQSDGCMVGPKTSILEVQCLCNHLSSFGSSFLVLPVQIDVTRTAEYFSQISQNPVIVILLACFYACYILSVIWARRKDRRDLVQNRILVPRDSDPYGLYRYLVIVHTGHRHGANTSAKVYLSVSGLYGKFGPTLLSDPQCEVFKCGNKDIFLLSLPYPLGELKSITLSHDGSGPNKRWYVTQVTIQDMQLKKSCHFLCNAWLDQPAKGDTSSRTFTAADDQELKSFRNIFLKKTLRGLRDEHIWLSVINHPSRSVFNRVQRVSCCMCLLLCTTVINLMFWEMPQSNYPVIITMGSISLTWKDIMIAVESALLMFPVNLLIIFIFRNTQPKKQKSKDKKGKKNANGKKGPSSQQNLATILGDLAMLARTLSQTSWNNIEVDLKQGSSPDFPVLLQIISQLLQKQILSENLTVSVPLAQLSNEDLHALFCGNYVSQKLKKVSTDLKEPGIQQTLDKQQYEEISTQMQALINSLEKSIPPVPIERSTQKKKIKKKRLPWWFLYIGWFILVVISIVSTYFTMMYGFLYGKQSSIRWIVSMTLSLFQSIFILQPLKVVGFAIFVALVLKKVEEDEEDLLDIDLELLEEIQSCDETSL